MACAMTPDKREGYRKAFAGFDVAEKAGALAVVGDGVQRFAGREPLSVEAALTAALKK